MRAAYPRLYSYTDPFLFGTGDSDTLRAAEIWEQASVDLRRNTMAVAIRCFGLHAIWSEFHGNWRALCPDRVSHGIHCSNIQTCEVDLFTEFLMRLKDLRLWALEDENEAWLDRAPLLFRETATDIAAERQ